MSPDPDKVARAFAGWGRRAKRLPAGMWDHAGISCPLITSGGHRIGDLIPGRGLAIHADLKTLGVTRPIPGVIERTPFMRAFDRMMDDRGAITSIATLQAAYVNTFERTGWQDTLFSSSGAGHWMQNFDLITPANISRTPSAPNALTPQAYSGQMALPPAGKTKYLAGVSTMTTGTVIGWTMGLLVDILSQIRYDATTLVVQSTATAALTRYTSGAGVMIALGVPQADAGGYAVAGTPVYTITYTNQSGTAGRTATLTDFLVTVGMLCEDSTRGASPMLPLASGDYGVQSVQSFQTSIVSTSAPGDIAVLLYKPLVFMHAIAEVGVTVEREVRSEPPLLIPLPVGSDNQLGSYTMIWQSSPAGTTTGFINFVFDCFWN